MCATGKLVNTSRRSNEGDTLVIVTNNGLHTTVPWNLGGKLSVQTQANSQQTASSHSQI